jgi:hypothetical protein
MRRGICGSSWILVLAAMAGCARPSIDVSPVHGIVSIDNKPLFQGKVMFAPVAKGDTMNTGKPAWGEIQKDGSFRLTTFQENDGAVIGQHWATIINSKEELPEGVPEFARFMVPQRVDVVAGKDNQIDIKLSSATIRKYREDDR